MTGILQPGTNTLVVGGEFTNFNGVNTHGVALLPPGWPGEALRDAYASYRVELIDFTSPSRH